MKIENLINKYREDINHRLSNIYPHGPISLLNPIKYVLCGSGKRFRPLLAILVSEACGGNKENVISPAIAVEILHNFTLVHDDIMDQDLVRHGQETVHRKWDDGIAILTGDAMLSLALDLINQSPIAKNRQMEIFIKGLLAVCEGQAIDKEFEKLNIVSIEEYIHMIDMKTGYMIGLSAQIGATSAGVNNKTSQLIRDYGRLLGRAFQIQDDYMEIFSNDNTMGKSLKSDILLGKKTYLIIHALKKNPNKIRKAIKTAQNNFEDGIVIIREYMRESGIQQITKEEIDNIIDLADEKISNLNINKEILLYFSNLIKNRGY